ncbi:MAG: O-antigen ligase family protein [Kosmotogaceae bacterium]|nr:O-antigen ligase family protein [Kosmotogaceae bacterium]
MCKGRYFFYAVSVFGSSLFAIKGFTWDMGLPKFYFASVAISVFVVFNSLRAVRGSYKLSISFPQVLALLFGVYACLTTVQLMGTLPNVFLTSLGFAMNLLLFLLFSVLISGERPHRLMFILQIFVFAGLVIALDAVFSFYTGRGLLWGTENNPFTRGNLSSVIGNVNFTTDLMAMLLFPTAFLTISSRAMWKREKLRHIFYLGVFSIFLIVILIGQTRAVYYSVIGSIIFLAVFMTIPLLRFRLRLFAAAFNKLFVILLILAVIVIMIVYSGDNFLTSGRFSFSERLTYTTEDNISVDVRVLQWKSAIRQWESSTIFGTGFGSYKYLSTENMGRVLLEEPNYMYVAGLNSIRTHNEYLQQLGETGIVGMAIVAWFILSMLLYTIRVARRTTSIDKIVQYIFLTAGLLVVFLHSILSFPGHLMPNALFAVFLFGFLMSSEFNEERRIAFNVGKLIPLILVIFAMITTVLMSRTFFSEGFFTKGYIDYRRIETINPQVPQLISSIESIKKEIESAENLEGEYANLQYEQYISERLRTLQEMYPSAPTELLESIASEDREEAYESTLSELNSKLRSASSALLNARRDSTDSFYSALRNLSTAREISDGQYLAEAYLGYIYLTPQRKEDLRLKLNMSGKNIGNAFGEMFSRKDIFSFWLTHDALPSGMLPGLEIDHAYLKELQSLLKPDLAATDVSNLLKEVNTDLLIDYQVTLDAIDALLRSTKTSSDLQVVRNAASLLFRVIVSSERVSLELEKLEPYVADTVGLNELVHRIQEIPVSEKANLNLLYDVAIAYNPGGWLKGTDSIYGEYARSLLLAYGLDALDKILELAEKEVFAWNVMRTTDRVVPIGAIGELTPLKEHVPREWFSNLYDVVYEWCLDSSLEISSDIEEGVFAGEDLKKAETVLNKMEKFKELYSTW